jgi:hypothetical protein
VRRWRDRRGCAAPSGRSAASSPTVWSTRWLARCWSAGCFPAPRRCWRPEAVAAALPGGCRWATGCATAPSGSSPSTATPPTT